MSCVCQQMRAAFKHQFVPFDDIPLAYAIHVMRSALRKPGRLCTSPAEFEFRMRHPLVNKWFFQRDEPSSCLSIPNWLLSTCNSLEELAEAAIQDEGIGHFDSIHLDQLPSEEDKYYPFCDLGGEWPRKAMLQLLDRAAPALMHLRMFSVKSILLFQDCIKERHELASYLPRLAWLDMGLTCARFNVFAPLVSLLSQQLTQIMLRINGSWAVLEKVFDVLSRLKCIERLRVAADADLTIDTSLERALQAKEQHLFLPTLTHLYLDHVTFWHLVHANPQISHLCVSNQSLRDKELAQLPPSLHTLVFLSCQVEKDLETGLPDTLRIIDIETVSKSGKGETNLGLLQVLLPTKIESVRWVTDDIFFSFVYPRRGPRDPQWPMCHTLELQSEDEFQPKKWMWILTEMPNLKHLSIRQPIVHREHTPFDMTLQTWRLIWEELRHLETLVLEGVHAPGLLVDACNIGFAAPVVLSDGILATGGKKRFVTPSPHLFTVGEKTTCCEGTFTKQNVQARKLRKTQTLASFPTTRVIWPEKDEEPLFTMPAAERKHNPLKRVAISMMHATQEMAEDLCRLLAPHTCVLRVVCIK